MNEPGLDRRSLTPCLDENGVDDDNCLESSKEIELSDISDIEDENWQECNKNTEDPDDESKANGADSKVHEFAFKKITRNTRGRNYRDNIRRNSDSGIFQQRPAIQPYRNYDSKRREMQRYNVRNVVANREFSISRSRSRSPRVERDASRHRSRSFSLKRDRVDRDRYKKKSISPVYYGSNRYKSPPRKYSPLPSKHSRSPSKSLDRYRNYQFKRSPTPNELVRRSRSRHKSDKSRVGEKSSKRKRHKTKDHQRKRKKSRSKSKLRLSSSPSVSSEPSQSVTSQTRQIMNVPNTSVPQENIKVILKNEDAIAKRQKLRKRDKKSKKEKAPRKEVIEKQTKPSKEPGKEVSKEVFASGDNILISVCFNNNNSNGKPKDDQIAVEKTAAVKNKSKKRQPSPASSVSSVSLEDSERRPRKHKRRKIKRRQERIPSRAPETPPITQSKRKIDMKPIAIIDLEKSPGKEVTQSPKEVIVLSDSDGEGKKRDCTTKDVIIIDDVILDKNPSTRNQAAESPSLKIPPPPTLKFALKSKSNILPFNLLHDHLEETEEQDDDATGSNTVNDTSKNNQHSELTNIPIDDPRDLYDPFEPTKSGSVSPVTPPPPNDVSSSSDMMKNKLESPVEKVQTPIKETPQLPVLGSEEHLISSSSVPLWSRKEIDKKQQLTIPTTPPLPPTFNIFSGSSTQTAKQHVSLYEGIYGNDLKTPLLPSPAKSAMKSSHDDRNVSKNDDDDRTPYSPSSDGYDFEPPPATNTDTQNNDLGSGSSYTFSSNDDCGSKSGPQPPLKLTASTLKTFNSTMRSTGPVGLQFVNKTELSIFENYLPASQQKSPLVKHHSSFLRSKMSRFTSSLNENGSPARGSGNYHEPLRPPVIDESMLDDEVPNSAVDLINKDRFLKKSLRLERVAEEVKLVLKPHYNKKHVTKEEYKDILRKAVPKICHNKTGEINIQKIHALVEAYIKKVRYKRKSGNGVGLI